MEAVPIATPSTFCPGNICAMPASAWYSLYHLLERNIPDTALSTRTSVFSSLGQPGITGKKRPCLIMRNDEGGCLVCVLCTFGGVDMQTLPKLMQDFLVPVFPTTRPDKTSLITTPPWESPGSKDQWIVAVPFPAALPTRLWTPVCKVELADIVDFSQTCQDLESRFRALGNAERHQLLDEVLVRKCSVVSLPQLR